MSNILLIEPDYKCKYPPLGLMKIAYYHKEKRNDTVWFTKGRLPEQISEEVRKQMHSSKYYVDKFGENLDKHIDEINTIIKKNKWDKIHVCTLFTFEYEKTLEAIEYAKELVGKDKVFTGGILATLMPEKLRKDTGVTVNTGQLINSSLIGYDDNINIDILTPDYSILDNTEYKYENQDAYYAYTTRGCGMKCGFCAVHTLEPEYKPFISIKNQIREVESKYGVKKDLLLMDNNVLKSRNLEQIVEEIIELGFEKGATYINPKSGKEKRRFVDFNQGLDAFLMTEQKAKLLGKIAIRPARIAFDHIEDIEVYERAIRRAATNGVNYLSNYILYNSDAFTGKGNSYKADTPEDLYNRLRLNVDLQEELNENIEDGEERIHIFSFPMRYIPLDNKQRGYVGANWTKKQLRAVQSILTPTQGKGVSSKSFFIAAFGESAEEFVETTLMPEAYIVTRGEPTKSKNINEDDLKKKQKEFKTYNKLRMEWKKLYYSLKDEDKDNFLNVIKFNEFDYKAFKNLNSNDGIKLFVHYLSESSLLTLLESMYMNEDDSEINVIRDYIIDECKIIYNKLIHYMLKVNKVSKYFDVFKNVFGNKGIVDIGQLWIANDCEPKGSLKTLATLYNTNEGYFYIIKWAIKNNLLSNDELIRVKEILVNNLFKSDEVFIYEILEKVFEFIKTHYDSEIAYRYIDEIKMETSVQMSLF